MTPEEIEKIAKQISEIVLKNIIKYFDNSIRVHDAMTPQEFFHYEVDAFGNIRHPSEKEKLRAQLESLNEQRKKLLEEEKYELLTELEEIYAKIKQEYDKL